MEIKLKGFVQIIGFISMMIVLSIIGWNIGALLF